MQGSVSVGDSIELPALKLSKPIRSMQMFKRPMNKVCVSLYLYACKLVLYVCKLVLLRATSKVCGCVCVNTMTRFLTSCPCLYLACVFVWVGCIV